MSLQFETPSGGIAGLFARIRQTRRRDAPTMLLTARPDGPAIGGAKRHSGPHETTSRPAVPEAPESKQKMNGAIPLERAAEAQTLRRGAIKAEELARFYMSEIAPGDYAFRVLKAEFDEMCADAKIKTVSDRPFALWLKDAGARKYRAGHDKVTMYKTPRRRRMAA